MEIKPSRVPASKKDIREIMVERGVKQNGSLSSELSHSPFVNIIAATIDKSIQGNITNFLLDDGSEKIVLRFFESNTIIAKIKVGDVLLVVGRVREYNNEKYLSPEIVKIVLPSWLRVRAVERKLRFSVHPPDSTQQNVLLKKENREDPEDTNQYLQQKIIHLVKELDFGQGAAMEDVVQRSSILNAEKVLTSLLRDGEIFQIRPGRVKIL